MTWFRVEDDDRKQMFMVEAATVEEACRQYIDIFRPDIHARPATPQEIEEWLKDPWPRPYTE